MELIETSVFTRQITGLLSDGEYRGFQSRIAANPELGALIKGGGGIHKVRVAVASRGKFWAVQKDVILLLYAYQKSAMADLTAKQVSEFAKVVKKEFRHEETDV